MPFRAAPGGGMGKIMLPAAVDERCEFLSGRWIDAAGSFLRTQIAETPALRQGRFALCERFSHPPPALDDGSGTIAWHFTLDAGHLSVGAGPLEHADLQVSGRYQAVLEYAQLVHAAGDDAVTRSQRETHRRWRTTPIRVDGALPSDPAVRVLLAALHDYMAARTVENPDFRHRVAEQGLTRQVAQLAEDGYAVIERAVSDELADALCARTAAEVTRYHPLTTNGLLLRDRLFEEVAQHPLVCTLAQSAVGQNMILGAMSGTYKLPGPGAIPIHADYPLVRDPYPAFGLIAVAVWALQDWDSEAVGPTWVLPGSHRQHRAPRRDESLAGAVPILMPKGSVLLISHGIWHWQGDRTAADARVAIHVTYNRVFVRQLDDLGGVDDAMLARNPPSFSTLLGRDDPFGRSSFRGHDARRFAYAGRFTQT